MKRLIHPVLALLSHDWSGLLVAAIVGTLMVGLGRLMDGMWDSIMTGLGVFLGALMAAASSLHLMRLARIRRVHPPPGRLIDMGGYRIHLLAEGQTREARPAIVWFGGGHSSGLAMHHLHRAFREHTRSILIDRPGTGWSDVGPFPRSTAREAEEIAKALERAGEIGPFVWAGHSFGGLLAANVARRRPDLVHTLVLLDPTPLETIVFGPRLAALQQMRRSAWIGGLAQMFGVNLKRWEEARARRDPAHAQVMDAAQKVLGPEVAAARAIEAQAGQHFAQVSIFEELTPEGVAACGWETVVYDRELGDLPVWLVAPQEAFGQDIANLPEAKAAVQSEAQRMARFFASTRERYLATSTRSRRVVAPPGSGHNFVYQHAEWTIGVLRELVLGEKSTVR